MPIHNSEIADRFERLADLLELEDANPFRVRAYRNAARVIRGLSRSLAEMVSAGEDLAELPGIGTALAEKIRTIVTTGRLAQLDKLESRVPRALVELMQVQGLGPKRIKALHEKLRIETFDDLRRAVQRGAVGELPGFGPKTEALVRAALEKRQGGTLRMKLASAEDIAASLVAYLRRVAGVKQVTVAGSFRRRRATIGDLDVLVTAARGAPVMERFTSYDEVAEVLARGTTRSTVRLRCGLQVDLRLVPPASYGAALHYFTGSKAHNIAVRMLAMKQGLKVNEYGVFRGDERIAGRTEEEVYRAVGLAWIAPELREDRGELDAARRGRLPLLITGEDIRGDLHCHSSATDGRDSIEAMAMAAKARGYEYLAIADHSRRVKVARGLDPKRLLQQVREIDRLNERLAGITILKSIEVDILDDGALDLPDRVLKQLDFTVCAVHYQFHLSRDRQTERILRAMDNPLFTILAHPTGRIINEREPYEVDLERVLQGAKERGCFVELNAQPDRLDLDDEACGMAREIGVKVAVSTDAHSTDTLAYMRYGIDQARRGWLTAADVLNTRALPELRSLLRRR